MDGRNLSIGVAALVVYLVAANPALTGVGAHEWLGLGVLLAFLAHVATHVDWVVEAVRGSLAHPSWARTGNLVLDALVVAALMTAAVSGLMVSGSVLAAFGLYAGGYYFWGPLHAVAAKALLALLLVHFVVHWKWIVRLFRRGASHE